MRHVEKGPLVATLKDAKLETVREVEIPLENFPDCIELPVLSNDVDHPLAKMPDRQFFRIGITDRRAVYREGVSYRISN